MDYNPNPRLTSEGYVHPSVMITIIRSGIFVSQSKAQAHGVLEIIIYWNYVAF
jgi:predicted carbohydrate-binding protein with CBM5 and CBM33 domain